MTQHDPLGEISPLTGEPRASLPWLAFLILFFASVFYVNEANWLVSTYESYALSVDDAGTQVADGNRWRQLSYLTVGALGALLTIVPSRQPIHFRSLPFALLCMYVLVCLASVAWSDAAWLTTKRLATSIFGLLAIIGVARQLSIRDLINLAIGIATILLTVGVYAEVCLGTFAPWVGEYRFAGIVHPNAQGGICSVMTIAAFFGMKAANRGKSVYLCLFLLAAGFLLLTKSRTSIAACLCGASAAWFLMASGSKRTLVGLALPTAVCAGIAAMLLLGAELSNSGSNATSLGREDDQDLTSLNGRVPLWGNVVGHIAHRPLLGYGYQAFWTSDRIYEVSLEEEWTVPNAHSVFLEVLLSTGLVGGTVLGLGVLIIGCQIAARCRQTATATDGFVVALSVYAVIAAIFESGFAQPNGFEPFIVGVGLLHVISSRRQAESTPDLASCRTELPSNWKAASAGGLA
ncbi:MAG: O-antigen ligase family protein [Planctomycetota bacterium]